MKQISLACSGSGIVTKRTRKLVFLGEMSLVVSWRELVVVIRLFTPTSTGAKSCRTNFAAKTMLRVHFVQQWFGLSGPAMAEALPDTQLYCEFARLDADIARMPAETTVLSSLHLLEQHNLSIQLLAANNATLNAAHNSTENSTCEREPEKPKTKKGNQWRFDTKALQGVGTDPSLVRKVIANVNDVTQGHGRLHVVDWHGAMRTGKCRALNKSPNWGSLQEKAEKTKARAHAKIENPFRLTKCQFGITKVRDKGLAKNTAQLLTMFTPSNVWMARRYLLDERG